VDEPLTCLILTSAAIAADRTPVEVALLALLVLEPTRLRGWTPPRLSPPARALRALVREYPAACRAAGLATVARIWIAEEPFVALLGHDYDAQRDALALAERVDQVTVRELATLGPWELVPRALGAEPLPRALHRSHRAA
jgi:hypothetical protein